MNTRQHSIRVKAPANTLPEIHATPCVRTNEGASSNPKGREASENNKNKGNKLLSCKNYIHIATLNVRTVRTPDKLLELANNLNNCNLNILGIIYHKIIHENDS